jgi:RecB family exonuclease
MRLSVSGLDMLTRCGEQYRFRYIDGIKSPPGWSLIVGRGVDDPVSADLGNKVVTGNLLPDEKIPDLARDATVRAWDEDEVQLWDEQAEMGPAKAKAEAIDVAVTLAKLHHSQAAPAIQPTHVQRYWKLDVKGMDLELQGVIDVQEGAKAVRDTKTSKKSPQADEAEKNIQLTTYALAVRQIDGAAPEKVALDYLVHTKVPKLVQIEAARTDEDYRHLFERIYAAHQAVEKGTFMPAPLDSWWCSERWCGYWKQCRYARRPATVSVSK